MYPSVRHTQPPPVVSLGACKNNQLRSSSVCWPHDRCCKRSRCDPQSGARLGPQIALPLCRPPRAGSDTASPPACRRSGWPRHRTCDATTDQFRLRKRLAIIQGRVPVGSYGSCVAICSWKPVPSISKFGSRGDWTAAQSAYLLRVHTTY